MLGHGGSSAGSYLTDPTSPHPLALCCDYPVSKCPSASIVATSTVRVKYTSYEKSEQSPTHKGKQKEYNPYDGPLSQLLDHFDQYSILSDRQHGFRSRRSCETQLISLTQELHEKLEEKSQVEMIVLDFSKAFDKVPHKRLMKKLWNYGVRGQTHSWIQSFLTNRQQRVAVDGESSDWVHVDSGVPQGTVLGPALFLSFINDLVKAAKHSQVRLFADDCVLYRNVKTLEDCELLQEDLKNLEKWEEKWSMSFNPDKCNSISITRKINKITHT